MKKKKNPIAKDLRTPKYRLKVASDKKKYSRKNQPNPDSLKPDKNWLTFLQRLYYICVTELWQILLAKGEIKYGKAIKKIR